jgi:hypothetical protein
MRSRRVATAVVLVMWVLLGPLAIAFEGCAGMGAMCEGPCGSTSCAGVSPIGGAPAPLTAYLAPRFLDHLLTVQPSVPDPPPKSLSPFA